jgi:hypothetical protein
LGLACAAWLFTTRKRTPTRLSYQDERAVRLPRQALHYWLVPDTRTAAECDVRHVRTVTAFTIAEWAQVRRAQRDYAGSYHWQESTVHSNGSCEKDVDSALEEQFRNSPGFVAWFLAQIGVTVVGVRYLWSRSNNPFGRAPLITADPQTGLRETVMREGETDVLVVLEDAEGMRFALHIENKVTSPFTTLQPELYAARAAYWVGSERYGNYTKFKTVLVAPRSFQTRWEGDARKFDAFVSYEDLAPHVPLVGDLLLKSA